MSSIPESAASDGTDDACDSWTKVEADDEEQSSEAAVSAEKFEMRYMFEEEDAEDPAEEMPDEEWPTTTSDPDDEQGLLLLSSPAFSLRAFNLLRMGENKKTPIEYTQNYAYEIKLTNK